MIEVRGLNFSYQPGRNALSDIDLTIPDGQWLAVVGGNGSGKSTLARQLNGLLRPSSGSVTVDGFSTQGDSLWQVRQRVTFVFQNPDNQLVATSVEDDVAFGPENLGLPPAEIERRVSESLAVVGLSDRRQQPPSALSGGEKQRLALAGALAMASHVLVLDEPTSMLDPSLRRSVLDCLSRLHQQRGLTVVYVTNLMEEVLLAQRVVVLEQGRLIRDTSPAELFADPAWLEQHSLAPPPLLRLTGLLQAADLGDFRGLTRREQVLERLC